MGGLRQRTWLAQTGAADARACGGNRHAADFQSDTSDAGMASRWLLAIHLLPPTNCGFVTVRARHDAKHVGGKKGGRGWTWQEWGRRKWEDAGGRKDCGCLACSRRVVVSN